MRTFGGRALNALFVYLLCFLPGLVGQTRLGSIEGTVEDQTGAPISGARVIAQSLDTGRSRSIVTPDDGRYRLSALNLGNYSVQVAASGFQTEIISDVVVNVNRVTRLTHVLLPATQRSSTTVTANTLEADASLSGLANLIQGDTIRKLPLNGRDYLQLALLQPGVTLARAKNRNNNTGYGIQLSIGGSRPVQNNFRLDGISLTDFTGSSIGSVTGVNLGVDALREFSVLSNGFSAEYGRAAGGVVNAVTRSGTNQLHGTVSYFHRNDNLDARNFFDPQQQPEFRRHQFGGALGGPIRRNRTFFFGDYESLRQVQGNTTTSTTISDAARNGFAGGQQVSIDPVVAQVLPFFPSPNGAVSGDTGLFTYTNNTAAVENFGTSRLDHNFSSTQSLFARYTIDDAKLQQLSDFAVDRARTSTRQQSFALEQMSLISPTLVNSVRFGIMRMLSINNLTTAVNPELDNPAFALVPGAGTLGTLDITGLTVFPGGSGAEDYDHNAFTSFQFSNDVSYSKGNHFLKFGVYLERTRFNADSRSRNAGEIRFNSVSDFLTNQPNRFRALLPGSDTIRGFRQWIPAWYIQDRWQMSRNFSLELGVRHEFITVPTEVNGKIANLDGLLSPSTRVGDPLFNNPSLKNFAPRAGFAWDFLGNGKTVIRGGYGIYYDQLLSQYLLIAGFRNPPFYLGASIRNPPVGSFPSGAYEAIVNSPSIEARAERIPRNVGQPYVQQWNFNIQQSLGRYGYLRLVYAGSHGVHMSGLIEDANLATPTTLPNGQLYFPADGVKANPNFGIIRDRIFEGHSFYESMQIGWEMRTQSWLQVQLSYLLSKNIDDDSSSFSQSESVNSIGIPVVGNARFNRGLSNYDQRHNFVANFTASLGNPTITGLRPVLGGWQASSIITLQSGSPFSVTMAYDAARTLTLRSDYRSGQRPNVNPDYAGNPVTGDPTQWFDPAAFLRPAPGFLGNLGRNTLTGPGRATVDMVMMKRVVTGGDGRFIADLRLEGFNILNHTNFNLPASERMQLFTPDGVRADAGRITSASPGRQLQIGLKVQF